MKHEGQFKHLGIIFSSNGSYGRSWRNIKEAKSGNGNVKSDSEVYFFDPYNTRKFLIYAETYFDLLRGIMVWYSDND